MAWIILIIAGLFEIAWAVALKYSEGFTRLWPSVIFGITASLSFACLAYALRTLPVGTAYAVWTGIGAVGIAILALGVSKESLESYISPRFSTWAFSYLPVISALTYAFAYGAGFGSVPFPLIGELLPEPARNVGTSISLFVRYFSVFVLLKMFPLMTDVIGLNGLFVYHSLCILSGIKFMHIFVEETNA